MKTKNIISFIAVFLVLMTIMTACKKEITDFFEALKDYGYEANGPLGGKNVPADQSLFGGYVYNSLPVIISAKDEKTYSIRFLSVQLGKEDVEAEAFMTKIENSQYLNVSMGDKYTFLKVNLLMNSELEINVLREAIKEYVPENNLKSWLKKNGANKSFTIKEDRSYISPGESLEREIDIWYTFIFNRITEERAYEIQRERLQQELDELFAECSDYACYKELRIAWPDAEGFDIVIRNIFNNCNDIESFRRFAAEFPEHHLSERALEKITQLELLEKDSLNFMAAKKTNTISGYEDFMEQCGTEEYKGRALYGIKELATAINKNSIEWAWTGGNKGDALKLIYSRIRYAPEGIDISWYLETLTQYTLRSGGSNSTDNSIECLGILAGQELSHNQTLDIYLAKGLLFWSAGQKELALESFRTKINEKYTIDRDNTFRNEIKERVKKLDADGLVLSDKKTLLKSVKKMK